MCVKARPATAPLMAPMTGFGTCVGYAYTVASAGWGAASSSLASVKTPAVSCSLPVSSVRSPEPPIAGPVVPAAGMNPCLAHETVAGSEGIGLQSRH